jgi:hypothetical protein
MVEVLVGFGGEFAGLHRAIDQHGKFDRLGMLAIVIRFLFEDFFPIREDRTS